MGVAKKFKHWIFGKNVIVYSDHNPITFLTETAPKSAKLMRRALAIQEFDVAFRYRKKAQPMWKPTVSVAMFILGMTVCSLGRVWHIALPDVVLIVIFLRVLYCAYFCIVCERLRRCLERQAVIIGATTYSRNEVIVLVGRVTLAVLLYIKANWASI